MDILISTNKKHADLIFQGIKNLFFCKIGPKELKSSDKLYFYEGKRNGGRGKVIGEAKVKEIHAIPNVKTGTYVMLPMYVELFGTEEEKRQVKKAMKIHLPDYDDSIVLSYLFDDWTLEYMRAHDTLPDSSIINPLWHDIKRYNEAHKKADDLCKKCDIWASKTGFYDNYGHSDWEYMIKFYRAEEYEESKEISQFKRPCGDPIKKIRSWCYVDKEKYDSKKDQK